MVLKIIKNHLILFYNLKFHRLIKLLNMLHKIFNLIEFMFINFTIIFNYCFVN